MHSPCRHTIPKLSLILLVKWFVDFSTSCYKVSLFYYWYIIRRSAHLKKRSADKQDKTETNSAGHTLTRRDKAKMEAIKTFDGDSLGAVLKGSRKRVARHFDNYPAKRAKAKESPDRDEASAANADSSTEASAN